MVQKSSKGTKKESSSKSYKNIKKDLDKQFGRHQWYLDPVMRDGNVQSVVEDNGHVYLVRSVPESLFLRQKGQGKLWCFDDSGRCVIENAHCLPQPYVMMTATGTEYFSICDQFLRGYSGFDYTRMFGEFDAHQFPKDQGRVLWIRLESGLLWAMNFAPQRKIFPDVFRTTYDLGSVSLFNRTECVGLEAVMTIFVPMNDKAELWIMDIKNISSKTQKIDAIPCVPIFGGNRAYAEYHRDVVRLYNKTEIDKKESVISIHPGLEWVEGATDPSSINYFMKASLENSKAPDRFYTDRDTFLGAHNQWGEPLSLLTDTPPDREMLGEEAVGAIEFKNILLEPGQSIKLYVITGIAFDRQEKDNVIKKYTPPVIEKSLIEVYDYWQKMTTKRVIKTKNKDFDFSWNKWWLYQLQLRFWFGNTGHPQFDYGSDFCGWREIWQDMIGTILMDSDKIEEPLIRTLEGIRMDGTNATRFFVRTRKFGSDEVNGLWCDHPYWTTQTILIYAEHVGNPKFLFHDGIRYFRDLYIDRGDTKDECWAKGTVGFLKNKMNTNATGTILEHLLCQLYPMFFDVGKNDLLAVKRADWNDAVDQTRGESVTFSMGFVEDCRDLAKHLEKLLKNHNITETPIAKELRVLIANNRSSIVEKRSRLKAYVDSVNIRSSGEKENVELRELINDLNEKSVLMKNRINEKAWTGEYYIAYFDHEGQAIKGPQNQDLAIYLMPQAFAIFSGVVEGERLTTMIQAVDKYLYDTKVGGYKLNYPAYETFDKDIGRITGFAAGTKENSAIFNHANLFYMNALARLKRAESAFKVWDGINPVRHSQMQSMILPWLPEYWVSSDNPNIAGKGEYPMLTGSAVWTRINFERFILGIRGEEGGLRLDPCLPRRKDMDKIEFTFNFRGARYCANYKLKKTNGGTAEIRSILVDGKKIEGNLIKPFPDGEHTISIELE